MIFLWCFVLRCIECVYGVTLNVYLHWAWLQNRPGHDGKRTAAFGLLLAKLWREGVTTS